MAGWSRKALLVICAVAAGGRCVEAQGGGGGEDGINFPWYIWLIISLAFSIAISLVICTLIYIFYNCAKLWSKAPRTRQRGGERQTDRLGLIPTSKDAAAAAAAAAATDEPDVGVGHTTGSLLSWELERSKISIIQQLGIGDYGPIYDAEVHITELDIVSRALVKVFQKGTSQDLVRFRQDVDDVMELHHPHVARLLGVVSRSPYFAVYELTVNGDLKSFLLSSLEEPLALTQLVAMATDVSLGLSYLESRGYVHTDVAARNCMVTQGLAVKIADFKVGRSLFRSEYAVQADGTLLPLRWMAPEVILKHNFTLSTTVWAFGVLLWEVMSRGKFPYSELADEEVAASVCQDHGCPSTLLNCPHSIQQVMERCWECEEDKRPSMQLVHSRLESCIMAKI